VNKILAKMILKIVQEYGSLSRIDITRLLYLIEREWFLKNNNTYSGIDYFRWNGGIYSRDVINTLNDMDGFEIVAKTKNKLGEILFEPTYDKIKTEFRLKELKFNKDFEKFFAEFLGKKFKDSEEIYKKIFSLKEINDAELGNLLLRKHQNNGS
jgi:hypothetical protein